MPTDHLVVMAAGRGTRMDPLTRTRPKVLLPVAGRPLMEHVLRSAVDAGFRRATLVVHEGADAVRAAYPDGALGLEVAHVDQVSPLGTGHAVAALDGHVSGDFVLVSGDGYLSAEDLRRLAATRHAVAGHRVDDARPYGLLDVADGYVQGILEKPADAVPGMVNAGAYHMDEGAIRRCSTLALSPRGEVELTDAITAAARDGDPPRLVEVPSWREAGRPWDLLDLQEHILQGMETRIEGSVGERVDMAGPVVVEEGARVLNGTRIEGPAWIGRDVQVGPSAYLRPSTYLADRSHVGGHVQIKNSILGEDTHVPHLSYVGDSVLGADCNLGAGTQVANLKHSDRAVRVHWQDQQWIDTGRRKLGTIMGDGVKTGINCSLNPGTILAPGVRLPPGHVASGWIEAQE